MFKKISNKISDYLEKCHNDTSLQEEHLSGAGSIFLLEHKLKKYYQKKYAICFCNATTSLNALCLAYKLNNCDIITSPLGWGGTVAPFIQYNNKIIFSEVDKSNYCLSPGYLENSTTQRTKAVLSSDFVGNAADTLSIRKFCDKNGYVFISDSAQSLGAYKDGKPAGYYSDSMVVSFGPGKTVFGGEGGAVLTDSAELYEKLIWLTQHPLRQRLIGGLYKLNEYGINGRMNPIAAILIYESFEESLNTLKKYQRKCFELMKQLENEKLIEVSPHINSPESSTFFCFSVQLKSSTTLQRVNEFLKEHKRPFSAIHLSLKLIPFDTTFRKQFRNKYSCSENLLKQKLSAQTNDSIKLIYSPKICTI